MAAYEDSVFLNVPFDRKYSRLFDALVFAIHDCGFAARSSLEVEDSGQARVEKFLDIIEQSKFGIHDISRAGLDRATGLARSWRAHIRRLHKSGGGVARGNPVVAHITGNRQASRSMQTSQFSFRRLREQRSRIPRRQR